MAMNPYFKLGNILIFNILISIFCCESEAQFSFNNTDGVSFKITTSTDNDFTKPRRGFKKRRYGIHTFFAEGGYFWGYYTGERYSVNYDLLLQSRENNALTARIGVGLNNATNNTTYKGNENFFPFGINLLLGRIYQFELGSGAYYYKYREILTPYVSVGFRYQEPKGGFMCRIACDIHLERSYDFIGRNVSKTAVYGPLVGLGWTF